MKLRKVLDSCGKFISGAAVLATLDSYFKDSKINTTLRDKLLEEQVKNQRLSLEIQELSKFENKLEIADVKFNKLDADLIETSNNFTHECEILKDINSKLKSTNLNQNDLSELNNDLVHHTENITNELSSSNNILNDFKEMIEKLIGSGSGSNSDLNFIDNINNFWINYNNFLITLSTQQKGALAHLLVSIFILWCLISIIIIIYGDYLIKYFKLEEKYTRLARFIQLRRKFEHFNLLLNISLIILILLYTIYVDINVFFIFYNNNI
jgi:hypothetical protein